MPHIIIEHTKDIAEAVNTHDLNKKLHVCLAAQETVKLESVKTRAIPVENAVVGDGSIEDFVHITVLLLEGRSKELKATMAQNIFNEAQSMLKDVNCALSVNVDDLGVYQK